jgi:hypothetical protein
MGAPTGIEALRRCHYKEAMAGRYLKCVAHRHDQKWEAICLDLDLAVQGSTLAEVQEQLRSAISSYIEDASAEPEPTRSRLLERRAPLSARIAWLWHWALGSLLILPLPDSLLIIPLPEVFSPVL